MIHKEASENASIRRIRSLEQQLQVISAKEEVQVRAPIKAGNDGSRSWSKEALDEHQQSSSSGTNFVRESCKRRKG